MSGRRPPSLAAAALATYATNVGVGALSLINVLIIARALGASGRGDVALLIAIPTLMTQIASISVHEANANLGGSDPKLCSRLATNSVVLAGFLGVAAAALVVGFVELVPAAGGEVERHWLWVSLLAIPVIMLRYYLRLLLQSAYSYAPTNQAWVAGPVTTLTVNGVMAVTGTITVGSAISVWIAGQVLGVLILMRAAHKQFGFGPADLALARRALAFGARTHLGRFMQVGNYRADQWLIGTMVGSKELGIYSVAVAWAELLFYVPGVIVAIQRPDLVRARTPETAAGIAARVLRRAMFLAVAAGAGLFLAAPVLCETIFGQEFTSSVDDLRILSLAAVGIVALELLTNALVAQNFPGRAAAAIGVAFVATISLDLLLIPSHGGLGAAIATTSAYTLGAVAAVYLFRKALRGKLRDLVPGLKDLRWYARSGAEVLRRAA